MQRVAPDSSPPISFAASSSLGVYDGNFSSFDSGGVTQYSQQGMGRVKYDFSSAFDDDEFWGLDASVAYAGAPVAAFVRSKFNSSGVLTELGRHNVPLLTSATYFAGGSGSGPCVLMRMTATTFIGFFPTYNGSSSQQSMTTFSWNGTALTVVSYDSLGTITPTNAVGVGLGGSATLTHSDGTTAHTIVTKQPTTGTSTAIGITTTAPNSRGMWRLDENRVLLAASNTAGTRLVIYTTSGAGTVTAGTTSTADINTTSNDFQCVVLSATKFVYFDRTNGRLQLYDATGSVITLISSNAFPGGAPTGKMMAMGRITDTEFFIAYSDGTNEQGRRVLLNGDNTLTYMPTVQLVAPTNATFSTTIIEGRGLMMQGNRLLLVGRQPFTGDNNGEQFVRLLKAG